MDTVLGRDRLRSFIDLILCSLGEEIDGTGIASRGCLSRYHFDRLVSAAIRESPGAFRRRLLLERAAWQLARSKLTITGIALGSGYRSVEGFTRAFSRAFGTTPARYRKAPTDFRLDAPNGIHFHPPGGLMVPGPNEGRAHMDFVDRIVGHDEWFTRRLLDRAGDLPAERLDRPMVSVWGLYESEQERASLRELLNEMVANKENWSAALAGRDAPRNQGTGIEGDEAAVRCGRQGVRGSRPRHSGSR
jgi:AraC family transcriptional regulator